MAWQGRASGAAEGRSEPWRTLLHSGIQGGETAATRGALGALGSAPRREALGLPRSRGAARADRLRGAVEGEGRGGRGAVEKGWGRLGREVGWREQTVSGKHLEEEDGRVARAARGVQVSPRFRRAVTSGGQINPGSWIGHYRLLERALNWH
jgi:hypothetical protein